MNLLIKFPTRQRKDKFFQSMDQLLSNLACPEQVSFLLSLDNDDEQMNSEEVKDQIRFYSEFYDIPISVFYGYSMHKIHACNRDLSSYQNPWDILLLFSDDMVPRVVGFDKYIIDMFEKEIPDTDGVLYAPDGFTPLNTLCILGRKYYERFNYIYYPEYVNFFCDNEFMEVSQLLKKEYAIPKVLFSHEHPCNTGKGWDSLYERNNSTWNKDQALYSSRREKLFNIQEVL